MKNNTLNNKNDTYNNFKKELKHMTLKKRTMKL